MSFDTSLLSILFALMSGVGVVAAYALIGSAWLILKTSGELQIKAVDWCVISARLALVGVIAVSLINPLINSFVYERWFNHDLFWLVLPLPVICVLLFISLEFSLNTFKKSSYEPSPWKPFALSVFIFILCFFGLAYSFFPYIVPQQLTIYEATAAPESLSFLLYGVVVVVPTIILYTAFSYRVFWGKVQPLSYY